MVLINLDQTIMPWSSISSMVIAFFMLLGPLLLFPRNWLLIIVSVMGVIIALGIWLVLSA